MDRITLREAANLPEVGPLEIRAIGSGGLVFGQLLLGLPVVANLFTASGGIRFVLAAVTCALMAVALPLLLVVQARQRALGCWCGWTRTGSASAVDPPSRGET